jgi:acetoin utilization deacetylase AcuC-like enzyme
VVRVFYSPAYVGAAYQFDTTRKAGWVADSIQHAPISGIELVEPTPLTSEQVAVVHAQEYVDAVRTGQPDHLAESQGFPWDAGLWPMVLASNGGAVAAARSALSEGVAGSLSSGVHHARRDAGAGYCTLNGLVLAAHAALKEGARSVLILDLDAHCGGGTASLIADEERIWQLDVSVDSYDRYASSNRIRLDIVSVASKYLTTIGKRLDELDKKKIAFDLCLYNAGMDPHEGCRTGGEAGITKEILAAREQLVFAWCSARALPVAFLLAGGYVGNCLDQSALVHLHRLTLSAAAHARTADPSLALRMT